MVLGADRLVCEVAAARDILDFRERRLRVVDLGRREYVDWSLYSVPLFRAMELGSRNALHAALKAAGVKGGPDWTPTLIQHELAISDPGSPPEIRRTETATGVSFYWKDKPLFEYRKEYAPASQATMTLLAQYFRYGSYGAHPMILRELQALPGIPKSITHTAYDSLKGSASSPTRRSRYVLDRVSAGERSSFSVAGFTETPPPELAEETALMGIARRDPSGASVQIARATQGFERAEAAGRYFEASLAALELYLQTGDPRWQQRALDDHVRWDPNVRGLDSALQPDQDHLWEAIRTLRSLRPKAGEFSHVLMLIEANLHARRRTGPDLEHAFDDARRLHLAALKVNPYNPSVWRDLGSTYQLAFATEPALFCFDFARELAPDHDIVHALDAMERRLEAELPEFFLPGAAARRAKVPPAR
jgi:tetratricopeptide (TPR) repeat protein